MDKTLTGRLWAHTRHVGPPWWLALRHIAFWLLFFAFFRALFILWLHAKWSDESPWKALWHALPLDLSTAGYLVAAPLLFWYIGLASTSPIRRSLSAALTGIQLGFLLLAVAIFGANVFVYEEWHTPLNSRAFDHFRIPGALLDSMSTAFKFGALALYVVLSWVWWRVFREITGTMTWPSERSRGHLVAAALLGAGLFVLIRGGLGKMPTNESAVSYSSHPFNNHAATNSAWHFVHSLIETRTTVNRYVSDDGEAARCAVAKLYGLPNDEPTPHDWLVHKNGQRPNVVFILLESMTAQVVAELGGIPGVCPNLGRLANEGLLFEQCYSSGYRTDQGLVAVLGGFPAQPDQSVVLLQDKAEKLPSVSKLLKKEGYATAFFYGGQLTFANMGVWLRHQQYEQIISVKNFSRAEITQLWGADDLTLFNKSIEVMRTLPQPFFSTIMTLSLHQPYDVPFKSRWKGNSEREKFLNSAAFADHAIGAFFQKARQEPWFDNTVFVLVADHGHPQPGPVWMDEPRARHIPLIITGPCISPEWQGRRIGKIGNHHDIPATILNELGISSAPFAWSKDLLSEQTPDFAYYSNENGLGWVTPQSAGFFQFSKKEWRDYAGQSDSSSQTTARAYLQVLYDAFLNL